VQSGGLATPIPAVIGCPHCRRPLALEGHLAGRVVACPHCQGHLQMPGAPAWQPPGADGPPPRRTTPGRRKLAFVLAASLGGVLLVGLTVFALWRAFAGGAALTDELRYLPDGSRLIVSLNVQALVEREAVNRLMKKMVAPIDWKGPKGEDFDFEDPLEKHTGIPLRDYRRLTFGVTFPPERQAEFVVVIKARDARRFRLSMFDFDPATGKSTKKEARFEDEVVGNYTMRKERDMAYCVPDAETILISETGTLRAILRRDKAASLAVGLREAMARADFAQAVAAAVSLKDLRGREREWFDREIRNELNRKMPGVVDTVETVSGQIRVGTQVDVDATLLCRNAIDATAAAEHLNGLLKEARHKSDREEGVPAEFRKVLASVRFNARGSQVTASFHFDPDQLIRRFEREMEELERDRERMRRDLERLEKEQQKWGK
jgi:hypothetical protein